MDDSSRSCSVEPLGGESELRFGGCHVTGRSGQADLLDLRADGRFDGAIPVTAFETLTQTLFGTWGIWHDSLSSPGLTTNQDIRVLVVQHRTRESLFIANLSDFVQPGSGIPVVRSRLDEPGKAFLGDFEVLQGRCQHSCAIQG